MIESRASSSAAQQLRRGGERRLETLGVVDPKGVRARRRRSVAVNSRTACVATCPHLGEDRADLGDRAGRAEVGTGRAGGVPSGRGLRRSRVRSIAGAYSTGEGPLPSDARMGPCPPTAPSSPRSRPSSTSSPLADHGDGGGGAGREGRGRRPSELFAIERALAGAGRRIPASCLRAEDRYRGATTPTRRLPPFGLRCPAGAVSRRPPWGTRGRRAEGQRSASRHSSQRADGARDRPPGHGG